MQAPWYRWPLGGLLIVLCLCPGGARADETVTLTTFYPQQPAQSVPVPAAGSPVAGFQPTGLQVTTTSGGRLLILWSLTITATAGNTQARAAVYLDGTRWGGLTSSPSLANGTSYTLSGHIVIVPATAGAVTVTLQWGLVTGGATVDAANSRLSVIELK